MTAAGVFALSVAAGAQSQAPRPAGSASDQSNSAMNRTVTVVGCLQRDAAPGASGGGAASTNAMFKLTNVQPATGASVTGAPAPDRSGAAPGNSSSSSAAEQAPSRGRSSQAQSDAPLASEYRLMAMGGVELAPHVGHKMQLTGTITPAADTAPGSGRGRGRSEGASPSEGAGGASSTQPGRSGNPGGGSAGVSDAPGNTQSGRSSAAGAAAGGTPTLHVTAVTMVAQSCQ
jgi:hypothetical protein